MKFLSVLALVATTNAVTLNKVVTKVNPNGADVTLGGEKRPWPPAPVAASDAVPRAGSATDASGMGKGSHDSAVVA